MNRLCRWVGVVFLAQIAMASHSFAIQIGNIYYTQNGSEFDVVGYTGPFFTSDQIIQSSVNGLPVTIITSGAFKDCGGLASIVIPDSVREIGYSAFQNCGALTNASIPNSVQSIGQYAFSGSGITSISIPNGVPYIPRGMCGDCLYLTNVSIPSSATTIGIYAFGGCSNLPSVNIPFGVTQFEANAFHGCGKLTNITIPSSFKDFGTGAFVYCQRLTTLTIPNSVKSLGDYCFGWWDGLTSIVIPNTVTNIGIGAFYNCVNLTNITIPDSVEVIGQGAFRGCDKLKRIIVSNELKSYILQNQSSLAYYVGLTNQGIDIGPVPTPQPQTIIFNAISGVYVNAAPFNLSASATSLLPVTFASADPTIASVTSVGRVTILKAGTTTITASQAGNSVWGAAPPVSRSLVVSKRIQNIVFPVTLAKTFGNAPFTLSAKASSGLPVSYTSTSSNISIFNNWVTILGSGTATIIASQAGNDNWSAASPKTSALVVTKAVAPVTLSGLSQTYSGGAKSIVVTTTPNNLPVTTTYNGSTNIPVNAGSYAVTARVNSPNYAGSRSGSLLIGKASNVITFPPMPGNTFGQSPYPLTSASASSGLPITYTSSAPGVARIASNTLTIVGAGTTIIRASQAGNGNYVVALPVARTLTVAKAAQTVSFSPTTQ
jgi:BspA type Leucine rich repeat region (6 copies)/MBG domain